MEKTSRRSLLRAAAAGGVAVTGLGAAITSQRSAAAFEAAAEQGHGHGHGGDAPLTGNHAHASVSFGQWDVNPDFAPPSPPPPDAPPPGPFDRQPIDSNRFRNVHRLLPFEVTIDEGGAVTFIISGVHQVVVYNSRETTLGDVQKAAQEGNVIGGVPPLVDYAPGRVYRGLDPRALFLMTPTGAADAVVPLQLQDRVEGVNFANPGRYLVVCGVVPHLLEGMHGYVNVRRKRR